MTHFAKQNRGRQSFGVVFFVCQCYAGLVLFFSLKKCSLDYSVFFFNEKCICLEGAEKGFLSKILFKIHIADALSNDLDINSCQMEIFAQKLILWYKSLIDNIPIETR